MNKENIQKTNEEYANASALSLLFDIAETLALTSCVVLLVFTFICRIAIVDGPSMNKTLSDRDALIVSDISFEPKYGDIVVFQQIYGYEGDKSIVKRVIATENQVVNIDFDTWTVIVDGVELDEDYRYLASDSRRTSDFTFPLTVPEGCVFVMGDNRNNSTDSRDMRIGMLDTRCIYGRVIARILPAGDIRLFERFK